MHTTGRVDPQYSEKRHVGIAGGNKTEKETYGFAAYPLVPLRVNVPQREGPLLSENPGAAEVASARRFFVRPEKGAIRDP